MKKLLPVLFVSILVQKASAQTAGLQTGPMISFFGKAGKGYGGELIANIPIQKIFSAGAGIQLLKLSTEPNLYAPVFATFKVFVPTNKIVCFFHVDPGYGFHSYHDAFFDTASNGIFKFEFKNTGGFYVGTGAGLYFRNRASPYINFQYSIYHLKYVTKSTDIGESKEVSYINQDNANSITITAGIWLRANKKDRLKKEVTN